MKYQEYRNLSEYEKLYEDNSKLTFEIKGILICGIFVLVLIIIAYMKRYNRYKLAEQDYEKYARMVLKEEANERAAMERRRIEMQNAPRCPQCKSLNIKRISTTSKVVSVGTLGLASGKIGKQYKCDSCKHMW